LKAYSAIALAGVKKVMIISLVGPSINWILWRYLSFFFIGTLFHYLLWILGCYAYLFYGYLQLIYATVLQEVTSLSLCFNSSILALVNEYLIDSPAPVNLSYFWGFGSLLGLNLVILIVSGVTLAMHYTPNTVLAFSSVEHIKRDVNNGWLLRYIHANGASLFFIWVYLHIGRNLFYGSYRSPRGLLWTIGVVIFIAMMATAFIGYVLPWGQMSLWGATVITNLLSAIPWIGNDLVLFIWGGFSVDNPTLNRLFSLHYLLPFILAALVCMHLMALHQDASNNPEGLASSSDRIRFHHYYTSKD